MILNWDLISHRDEEKNIIHYALLIDGQEMDARIIAKKLGKYAKAPILAEPPFSYEFPLADDLDEAHLDKIRVAVQEGVESANKVNQFVPNGTVGDPLFNNDLEKTQTSYPTFLTIAPLDSLNQSSTQTANREINLDVDFLTQRSIRPDELASQSDAVPTDLQNTDAAQSAYINFGETEVSSIDLDKKEETLSARMPISTQAEKIAPEPELKNTPPEPKTDNTPQKDPSFKAATDLENLSFFAQKPVTPTPTSPQEPVSPTPTSPQEPVSPTPEEKQTPAELLEASPSPEQEPTQTAADSAFPLTDHDMLNKDMEGTLLDNIPLEDIFAAETRMDIFVDAKNIVQQQKQNKLAQVTPTTPPSDTLFDVFAQDLKDQTSFLDIEQLQQQAAHEEQAEQKQDVPQAKPFVQQEKPSEETIDLSHTNEVLTLSEEKTQNAPAETSKGPSIPHPSDSLDDLPEITLRKRDVFAQAEDFAATAEVPAQPDLQNNSSVNSFLSTDPDLKPIDTQIHPTLPRNNAMEEQKHKTILKLKPKIQKPQPPLLKPTAPIAPKPVKPEITDVIEKTQTLDHSIQMPRTELKKHNWPLEIPLIPTYTLNNMVMSVNRFAHATAISVIESPGKLYNPLVFHGTSGTGKSHILNALAYAFSQKFGQTNIFMTNGVRLSRGIQRYMMEGTIDKFDRFISNVKVLLIDDIHLLAINEQNRSYISKLLNTFLKEQKQIVITSKYPPESLEKLEELIKFRLDSGWISELKPATGNTHLKIVKKMLIDNRVELTDSQAESFFSGDDMTLGTVMRSIRRLKVLENILPLQSNGKPYSQADILEKLLPFKGEDDSSVILSTSMDAITSIPTHGNGEWGRIGIFYPQDSAQRMNWVIFALQQRAKELELEGGFDIVVRSSYATENIISSAFKIANLCDNKKLKGAIILGPNTKVCNPAVRENFYDILTHMLEVMLIRCAIINDESVRLPSTYVKLLAELMR